MEGTLDSFVSSYLVAKGNLISEVHVNFPPIPKKWDKILSLNKKKIPNRGNALNSDWSIFGFGTELKVLLRLKHL